MNLAEQENARYGFAARDFHRSAREIMMMSKRENILRSVRFERPERIPMGFWINPACRNHYPPSVLNELQESHPYLFPDFRRSSVPPTAPTPPVQSSCVDAWGVTMASPEEGIAAVSVRHPFVDWSALECYSPPSLPDLTEEEKKRPDLAAENRRNAIAAGTLVYGGLPHGHTFLRLCDLRGYEALICDMADGEPRLWRLIEMIEAHNEATVRCSLRRGAEWMGYPEDLGMQVGPMLSPEHLRKYQTELPAAHETGARRRVYHPYAFGRRHPRLGGGPGG